MSCKFLVSIIGNGFFWVQTILTMHMNYLLFTLIDNQLYSSLINCDMLKRVPRTSWIEHVLIYHGVSDWKLTVMRLKYLR